MYCNKYLFALLAVSMIVFACNSDGKVAEQGGPTEGQLDSNRAKEIAQQFQVSKMPTKFDACELLDTSLLVKAAAIKYTAGLLVESVFQQAGKSTCIFTWGRGRHSLTFQMEFNEKISQAPDRYTKYLKHLLEDGEPADPQHPDSLHRFNIADNSVGSPAVWSSSQRSLRWHIDNVYQGFMYLTHGALTESDTSQDSILLTTLAPDITQRLPQASTTEEQPPTE